MVLTSEIFKSQVSRRQPRRYLLLSGIQGTRETLADTNLIKIGRVLWRKLWLPIPKRRRKLFQRTRIQRLLRRHQHIRLFYSSEGSFNKRVVCPLLKAKMKKQKTSACMTVNSSDSKNKERLCCLFPGSVLEIQKEINQIFMDELSLFFTSKTMEKVFENINVCAIIKNKQSIKNHVVKTKI